MNIFEMIGCWLSIGIRAVAGILVGKSISHLFGKQYGLIGFLVGFFLVMPILKWILKQIFPPSDERDRS